MSGKLEVTDENRAESIPGSILWHTRNLIANVIGTIFLIALVLSILLAVLTVVALVAVAAVFALGLFILFAVTMAVSPKTFEFVEEEQENKTMAEIIGDMDK